MVSATNRDLDEAIKAGTFRSDLYHRLKIITVNIPPLKDRPDDIVPLLDHFRKHFSKHHHKAIKGTDNAVVKRFYDYDWPGNVRQLKNFVESMVVIDLDGTLGIDDLPPELLEEGDLGPQPSQTIALGQNQAGLSDLVGQPLSEVERQFIAETLKFSNQNREEAAKMLQIGERTLYRKIKEYNLREES